MLLVLPLIINRHYFFLIELCFMTTVFFIFLNPFSIKVGLTLQPTTYSGLEFLAFISSSTLNESCKWFQHHLTEQ